MWEQIAVRIDATQNHVEAQTPAHMSLYQWLLTREAMSTHQHPCSASTCYAPVTEAELAHLCTRVVPDTRIFELHFVRVLIINFIFAFARHSLVFTLVSVKVPFMFTCVQLA